MRRRLPTRPRGEGLPPLKAAVACAAVLLWTSAAAVTADDTPPPPALPPAPAVQAAGSQAGFGDVLVVGPGARLEPATGSGPVLARLLDGVEVSGDVWASGWSPGAHVAGVRVTGADGAPHELVPLRFVYDPEAPTLEWEVGSTALLERFGLDQDVERRKPPRHTVPERDRSLEVLWSPDGRRWLPLLPRDAEPDSTGALADWLIAADRPQVFLWALDDDVFGPAAPVAPEERQLVRIWGADTLSAVRDLRLRVLPAGGTRARRALELVATDLVGNTTTVTWPLAR